MTQCCKMLMVQKQIEGFSGTEKDADRIHKLLKFFLSLAIAGNTPRP